MANGKKKGNKGEREVAKWFKQWTGYDFTRVPSSGGLRWHRKNDTVGDLICADEKHGRRFPFSVECKSYKELNILPCLINQKTKIIDFWHQAKEDSERSGKEPLLFMRYNNMKKNTYFVAVDKVLGHWLLTHISTKKCLKNGGHYTMTMGMVEEDNIYLFSSDLLLDIDYQEVYKFVRKKNKKR